MSQFSRCCPRLLAGVLLLLAIVPRSGAEPSAAERLDDLVTEYTDNLLLRQPLYATQVGDSRYNDRLPRVPDDSDIAKLEIWYRKILVRLESIPIDQLHGEQRITWRLLRAELDLGLEELQFPEHLLPVSNPFASLPLTLPNLGLPGGIQPLDTVDDYENYLARLEAFPEWVDQAVAAMRQGMKRSVTPPRVIVESLLPTLQSHASTPARQSPFFRPLDEMPKTFDKSTRKRLKARCITVIDTKLRPSYAKLHAFLDSEYRPHCRSGLGMNQLPRGRSWYRHRVRSFTTTDLSPERIFEIGLEEAHRIITEMDQLIANSSYSEHPERFAQIMSNDRDQLLTSPREMISHFKIIGRRIQKRLPELFSESPETRLEIRGIDSSSTIRVAHYRSPPLGSGRPGVFFVNTRRLPQPKTGTEALYAHEAIPGHHFQISVAAELDGLTPFRRLQYQGAYTEGWALYAESLGEELGLYDDPFQDFGRLRMELLRCSRLISDVAIHDFGWDRDAVIKLLQQRALGIGVGEIERLAAWPAQGLTYKIGQMRFLEIRRRCEAELGDRFDIREFHTQLLGHGALPLDLLEDEVLSWLESQREGSLSDPDGDRNTTF